MTQYIINSLVPFPQDLIDRRGACGKALMLRAESTSLALCTEQPLQSLDCESIETEEVAMLLAQLRHTLCMRCGTDQTPLWRRGPTMRTFDMPQIMCNACGIREKRATTKRKRLTKGNDVHT